MLLPSGAWKNWSRCSSPRESTDKLLSQSSSMSIHHTPEATLVEDIARDILEKLSYASSSNIEDGRLIGIRSRIKQVESSLSTCSGDVRVIGIWGMGGIGKSTLARAFFNHNFNQFEGHCFLANVREESQKRGLNNLREKFLSEILKDAMNHVDFGAPHLGLTSFTRNRLRQKKVLVVLDDVNDLHHLEFLAGGCDDWYFGPGSIIIVTSRDKQVLKNGVHMIYQVQQLDHHEALYLFGQYAFKQRHPMSYDHIGLCDKVIKYANGNPLALKVLGSFLFQKSKEEQESALKKLERTPNMDIQKVLQLSYDGLDYEQQNIFLDVACFFKGRLLNEVKTILDGCGFFTEIGISVLVDKSLLVLRDERLEMHDMLQEMGREIVRRESIQQPGKRTRLWDSRDISRVLTTNTGTEALEGIIMYTSETTTLTLAPTIFSRMHNLRLLGIKNYPFSNGCKVLLAQGLEFLPHELRYLEWDAYPLASLPSNFHAENLVVLRLCHSHVEQLWNGRQNLANLKHMDLSSSTKLRRIPDLSMATNLETLHLYRCKALIELPSSVEHLHKLLLLNLRECERLTNLPTNFSALKSLEYLDLFGCSGIKHLNLGCTAISVVPSSIGYLPSLDTLEILNDHYLDKPPLSIPGWTSKFVRNLCLSRAAIEELPESLGSLCSLEFLDLKGNNFRRIPETIKHLTKLRDLNLTDCRRLESLPQLPMNIENLFADNCTSLQVVSTPLTTIREAQLVGDQPKLFSRMQFSFCNCFKLDGNSRNSIIADVEFNASHFRFSSINDQMRNWATHHVCFPGSEVPYCFNYKSNGSSITAKLPLPPRNAKLLYLALCCGVEFKDDFPNDWGLMLNYNCHVRYKNGDNFNRKGCLVRWFNYEGAKISTSHHLFLKYKEIEIEADHNVDEITIEFFIFGRSEVEYHSKVKKCGIHLMYSTGTYADQLYLKHGVVDEDVTEAMVVEEAKNGGCFNGGKKRRGFSPDENKDELDAKRLKLMV
ncbi:disease resistance-like protein DSC1 isoform X2 [Tripterygium wilfordii]|uniref:disease resistance-like protein DSC1 isoform X2 n=1 Tax=Tripterygium wilfordii TaxID=458696 RepID=UPI0018F8097B|nr:disease resistance-like protein DSC1 isoform X2 [Tripterygium wilfordii]